MTAEITGGDFGRYAHPIRFIEAVKAPIGGSRRIRRVILTFGPPMSDGMKVEATARMPRRARYSTNSTEISVIPRRTNQPHTSPTAPRDGLRASCLSRYRRGAWSSGAVPARAGDTGAMVWRRFRTSKLSRHCPEPVPRTSRLCPAWAVEQSLKTRGTRPWRTR